VQITKKSAGAPDQAIRAVPTQGGRGPASNPWVGTVGQSWGDIAIILSREKGGLFGSEVLTHLTLNIPNYYGNVTQRELAIELAGYLARRLEILRPEEASAARVLRELIINQRLG